MCEFVFVFVLCVCVYLYVYVCICVCVCVSFVKVYFAQNYICRTSATAILCAGLHVKHACTN